MLCMCVYVFLFCMTISMEKHQVYAVQLKSYKQNFWREPLEKKSHDNEISVLIL